MCIRVLADRNVTQRPPARLARLLSDAGLGTLRLRSSIALSNPGTGTPIPSMLLWAVTRQHGGENLWARVPGASGSWAWCRAYVAGSASCTCGTCNSGESAFLLSTVMSPESVNSAAATSQRIASWVGDHKRDAKRAGLGEER
jgi:hypothetical protein